MAHAPAREVQRMREFANDEALCNVASPGPWTTAGKQVQQGKWPPICNCCSASRFDEEAHAQARWNAEFIANSREALPHYMERTKARGRLLEGALNQIDTIVCAVCRRTWACESCYTRIFREKIREELRK